MSAVVVSEMTFRPVELARNGLPAHIDSFAPRKSLSTYSHCWLRAGSWRFVQAHLSTLG